MLAPITPNADWMPVILTTPKKPRLGLLPREEGPRLQRPLPSGVLRVVSIGYMEDPELPLAKPTLF